MAKFVIPWQPFASFRQNVLLDQQTYIMHAKYNSTYDYYTLDILDVQNNPILTGVKIVLGVEMLQPYKKDNLPPGKLTPVAIKNVLRAGKDTMGTDIEFVYDSTAV